ncbi:MAG: RNA-binding protein [Thermoproteota archaeon]|nr:MAG: RNA-binding protein [Candidatus Korarchaeota archaeon]
MSREALYCTSCGRRVTYQPSLVTFYCPNCGEALIVRCRICRQQANRYICPVCGFEGP